MHTLCQIRFSAIAQVLQDKWCPEAGGFHIRKNAKLCQTQKMIGKKTHLFKLQYCDALYIDI